MATRFNVSESWVRRIQQERREQGNMAPCKKLRRVPKWAAEAEQIQAAIAAQPDLTLAAFTETECRNYLRHCGYRNV